jgi:hypothetical protein
MMQLHFILPKHFTVIFLCARQSLLEYTNNPSETGTRTRHAVAQGCQGWTLVFMPVLATGTEIRECFVRGHLVGICWFKAENRFLAVARRDMLSSMPIEHLFIAGYCITLVI